MAIPSGGPGGCCVPVETACYHVHGATRILLLQPLVHEIILLDVEVVRVLRVRRIQELIVALATNSIQEASVQRGMHLIRAALGQPITQLSQHGSASAEGVGGGPVESAEMPVAEALAPGARRVEGALAVALVGLQGHYHPVPLQLNLRKIQIVLPAIPPHPLHVLVVPPGPRDQLHPLRVLPVPVGQVGEDVDGPEGVPGLHGGGVVGGGQRHAGGRGGVPAGAPAVDHSDAVAGEGQLGA
eukprot:CAMPEP_0204260294 /NCGR_PEP_ID=MMETSP0468-20130131/6230_1 /ASSEMBLY_ACC=CAM_ASM_000383 /TAXON_ID=2969 /ORGANISM="Oxyrrhis marina" /LENGTH=241 /DNA_ID=CAMNT_0051234703 /DNA_START=610 /DNA_END=1333 /DNA_ORIENTATION=-